MTRKLEQVTVDAGEDMANILTKISAMQLSKDKNEIIKFITKEYSGQMEELLNDYINKKRTSLECIFFRMYTVEVSSG